MTEVKRLLIVDDEESLTFSLYQIFINVDFDLVITDISMPGITGLDLLSMIKARHPKTRVIIITAYGSDENKEQALQRGAENYIEKPFDLYEIRDLVIQLLTE
jgi:YesN/AraC family two-component response regulator